MATKEQNNKLNPERVYTFACILYPDDSNHMQFMQYMKAHEYQYQSVWIFHDKDVEAGEPCKPHYHFMFKQKERQTPSAVAKYFDGWVKHFEPVGNPRLYLNYMIHDTPASRNKHQYSPTELQGSEKLMSVAFDKAQILYNLEQLAIMCKEGCKVSDIVIKISNIENENEKQRYFETFNKYQHIVVAMSQQERIEQAQARKREKEME